MLDLFEVPASVLPEVLASDQVFGETRGLDFLPDGIPIAGMMGDQQAALFGQACFGAGDAKCTYGTGAFLLMNVGREPVASRSGLLSTAAWRLSGKTTYALEGSVFIAGAAVQWLRDGLGIIRSSAEVEKLARSVKDSGGVILVPAFTGLGAPYWRPDARGALSGITRGTTAGHVARAALEGIAFQCADLLRAMERDTGKRLRTLKVDGGAADDDLLLEFQADILQRTIVRPKVTSITALGAALLAGLTVGAFPSLSAIQERWEEDRRFSARKTRREADLAMERWHEALSKV
jgi:glycerol kinase